MLANRLSMQNTIGGEQRLANPVDDAILTLGVRLGKPLSYQEIAALFSKTRDEVSQICEPYKEFLRHKAEVVPGLFYRGQSLRQSVLPGAMWNSAMYGNSGRESFQMQQLVTGADRLTDPVDDAILTLAVRKRNPLSYEEIATLLETTRQEISKICKPYKEFIRTAGEYGIPGLA